MHSFHPPDPLAQVASYVPVTPERRSQSQRQFMLPPFENPRERLPEIVVLPLQPLHPHSLLRSGQLWFGFFCLGEEESCVPVLHLVDIPTLV
jgi:hypothetical protein